MKIFDLIKKLKYSSIVGKYLQHYNKVDFDYSFMLFGSHGVGLHSLLYFLSLCETINGHPVFPIPMFWAFIENWRYHPTARIYWHRIKHPDFFHFWGITFDNSPKSVDWINKNLQLKVPSLMLVRDPISAIVSKVNFDIHSDIMKNIQVINAKQYINHFFNLSFVANPDHAFEWICAYRSNLLYCEHLIKGGKENLLLIDTSEITGEITNETMERVTSFLGIKKPNIDFNIPVNTSFSRLFPVNFIIEGSSFRVSPFVGKFGIKESPYCEKDLYFCLEKYKSPIFPNVLLYISSLEQNIDSKKIEKLKKRLEIFLFNLKNKLQIYDNKKINEDDVIDFILTSSNKDRIIKKLQYETDFIFNNYTNIYKKWSFFEKLFARF